MDELLKSIKQKLADMKKIENSGFSDPAKAAEYFRDKEMLLEEMAKTLETVTSNQSTQIAALEGTIKSFREDLRTQVKYPKELSRRELLYNLGKGIAAAWSGNHKVLADLAFSPNMRSENWTNPKDVSWSEKGWTVSKAALGDPMGNMATNEQFLINPIYETEIMQEAAKKSVMMNLVRHRPMTGPSIFLPTRDRAAFSLTGLLPMVRK